MVLLPRRSIVHRQQIDRDRVGGGVEINSGVERAAVVLHLKRERFIRRADSVGGGGVLQQSGRDVGHRNILAGGDRHAVVLKAAGRRQRRDFNGQQIVRRRIV